MTRRKIAVLLGSILVLSAAAFVVARIRQSRIAVPTPKAVWVIARVQASVFGTVNTEAGCFSLRTGKRDVKVFVVDPSYTNYQVVHCDTEVTQDGRDYRLTVTQLWEDASTPDGGSPFGWVLSLFYHPPAHTWEYRIRSDGTVLVLPEHGPPPPQTYYH